MLQPAFADLVIGGRSQRLEYAWIGAADPGAPVIVFLHEGLGSLAMWKDYPAELCAAASARGLVFSRYGYGRSTPRPALEKWPVEFMHAQAVEVLPALFAQVQLHDPPWLFGHSDGASIALLHASLAARPVRGVVVMAPHVLVEEVSIRSIQAAKVTYETTDLRDKLRRYHADPDSAFRGWNEIWLHPEFRDWNIEDCLPGIRAPILAIQGEDDEYGTMAQIARLAHHVPQARLVKLAQCGHSPHRDQPERVVDAAASFVRTSQVIS